MKILEWWSYNVTDPHFQKTFQKLAVAQKTALVQLLLPQVAVVVHRLHKGANAVYSCLSNSAVLLLQCFHYFIADRLSEAWEGCEGRKTHFTGNESSDGVKLCLQLIVTLQLFADQRIQGTENHFIFVLSKETCL